MYISQGSVATQLRYGTLLQIFHRTCWWKNWKSVNIRQRHGQKFVVYYFGPNGRVQHYAVILFNL